MTRVLAQLLARPAGETDPAISRRVDAVMRRNAGRQIAALDRARRCFEQLTTEHMLREQCSTPVATRAAVDVVNDRHPIA
jgi:hypothetical protein